ncbi:MAG TPA: ABC transporter substrate-binding protein [Acidimicrobiales bacterium]|jgi:iron complex transport system substrate-binding protein|nr:ABC transporter substrate-binding protein [Acidimicrobiales bacterium]
MLKTPKRAMLGIAAATLSLTAIGVGVGVGAPAVSAGAATTTYPVTIKAANGNITIPARPTAIVSLSPTATEMLYAIGAGSQVKAVDSYSDFPKNAPITKLSAYQPNVEAIVAYKPDLVIVSGDTTGITAALAKFGIPVLSDPAATVLSDEYAQFTELGQATGHVAQAATEVAKVKTQIARIVKATPKAGTQSYYWELEQDYYSVTSSTFIGQVLNLLHLHSIADAAKGAAASGGYPQLSAEYIIKANPKFIFLADTLCCHQTAKKVDKRAGWKTITAVKDGNIVPLNDDIASRWGPRIVTLLREVANAVTKAEKH